MFFSDFAVSNDVPQEISSQKEIEILLKMSLFELVEVTVASKQVQSLNLAPSSVSVFNAKEIKRMGIKSVQELLNFVPGFQSTRESRLNQGYTVSARGTSTSQASYNILFMLDGQRLNDVSSSGANAANHYLGTANIKQVEIIRGPGSALYGTGAFTGVVNIITKDKAIENTKNSEKDHQFYLAGGNLDSHEFHGLVSKQEKEWGVSLFGSYYDDDGQDYQDSSNAAPDEVEKDQEIYLKLRWRDILRLNMRYSEEEFRGFLGERETENLQQQSVRLEYAVLKREDWKLMLYGSFQQGHLVSNNIISQEKTTIKDYETNLGFNGSYQFNPEHQLSGGLEWRYATVKSNVIPKSKRDVLGIYLQHQYQIRKDLELTLGLRYDRYSDTGDNTLNPRIALIHTTDFGASFKFMYGQAFRVPSLRQLYQNRGLGNSELKAEEIKTLEFVWLQSYQKILKTSFTYFHSWSENKINTVVVPKLTTNDIGRQFVNIDERLRSSGIEFEMQANFTKEFSLRSTYTYLIDTEENPRRVAKNTMSIIANYQWQALNINLNGYYHDEMDQETSTGLNSLNDYWIFNANLRYELMDGFTFVGQGHNLFNTQYHSSTKLPKVPNGIPSRGRTYSLGFEVTF